MKLSVLPPASFSLSLLRYSGDASRAMPTEDDPRLAQFPAEMRKMLIAQIAGELKNPDVMVSERCAITCRVAPSFTRVGHVEVTAEFTWRELDRADDNRAT